MAKLRYRYIYSGPVKLFNDVVDYQYVGSTIAVSEKQALNNLTYQWKKSRGYSVDTKYTLNPEYLTKGFAVDDYDYYDKDMKKMMEEMNE